MIIGFESNKIILRTTQRKVLESIISKDIWSCNYDKTVTMISSKKKVFLLSFDLRLLSINLKKIIKLRIGVIE